MSTAPVLEHVPLSFDADGVIRVSGTRIPIDTILEAYNTGATPEEISSDYPVLALDDVYAVLAYYLRHREEIAEYLARRQEARTEVRRANEARSTFADLRRRLLARRLVLRFLADENFNGRLLRGLRRAYAEIDVLRAQDVGLESWGDPALLAWAAQEERVLLTHDVATITAFANERLRAGLPMPGVIEVSLRQGFGAAIDDLKLLAEAGGPEDCANLVLYLPL